MTATLLQVLEQNPDVRKIFGKRELVIIRKQLLGIRLTQSEKNRLSRDIRRKFAVIQELSRYSASFKLQYGGEIKKKIQEVKEAILESRSSSNIKKIVLFGSTADNTRLFRSDIDIAVEFDFIDVKKATEFRINISRQFGKDIDIKVYNILPDKVKKEIDGKGRTLYERPHQ